MKKGQGFIIRYVSMACIQDMLILELELKKIALILGGCQIKDPQLNRSCVSPVKGHPITIDDDDLGDDGFCNQQLIIETYFFFLHL
jgi:hypothetical protein